MTQIQIEKVSKYLVEKLIKDNLNNGVLNDERHDVKHLRERLYTEVEARLSLIPEYTMSLEDLVSAMENQINITDLLTEKLTF